MRQFADMSGNREGSMIDPTAITEARQALGRQLAACREAAGLVQEQLAPLIHYGRSTIANAETGYSTCSRTFWQRCDHVLKADGALLRGYDEFKALTRQQQADVARVMEAERGAKFRALQARQGSDASVAEVVAGLTGQPEVFALSADGASSESGPDSVVLRLQLDGREIVLPLSRRLLLQAGISSFVETFALSQQFDMLHEVAMQGTPVDHVVVTSPAHLREIVTHLREQWHALVKTDNLLGPRFALASVLNQITTIEALLPVLRGEQRLEIVGLGAQYAESAAWLYEDVGNMAQARYWTSRAMEWAYEGDDERMVAWTIFRRSQQAAATPNPAQVIGLAQAARRHDEQLATPTRAAIRVQEAYGHALDGDEQASQRLLDKAHTWAASDTVGDARDGHGSYCTPSYIEIQRANCWLATGRPKKAVILYEEGLRTLPAVYQRNRAAALSRLAVAYTADGKPEQAANTAHAALPIARSTGSRRTLAEIRGVGAKLAPQRSLHAVAALLVLQP
jgi:tetratricopeptide (TPR) repeat protein